MYLRCPECKTRYEISASSIPEGGARVRCPRCRTVFTLPRPAAPPEVPAQNGPVGSSAAESPAPPGGAAPSARAAFDPAPFDPGSSEALAAVLPPPPAAGSKSAPPESVPMESLFGRARRIRDVAVNETTAEAVAQAMGFRADDPSREGEDMTPGSAPAPGVPAESAPPGLAGAPPAGTGLPSPTTAERRGRIPGARTRPIPLPANSVVPGAPVDAELARRIARALVSELLMARREARDEALREGRVMARLGPAILVTAERYRERVGAELADGTRHFQDAVNDIIGEGRPLL